MYNCIHLLAWITSQSGCCTMSLSWQQRTTFAPVLTSRLTGKCITYYLINRHDCFTGICTTREIQMKLHPRTELHIFLIHTGEDIDDIISRIFMLVLFKLSIFLYDKKKLHGDLKIWILFSDCGNNILRTSAENLFTTWNNIHIFARPCFVF